MYLYFIHVYEFWWTFYTEVEMNFRIRLKFSMVVSQVDFWKMFQMKCLKFTSPKTHISPEKWWLEHDFPIFHGPFSGDIRYFSGSFRNQEHSAVFELSDGSGLGW